MSRDPWQGTGWRPTTLNYYTYVHGNPINHVDPSGNCILGIDTFICAAVAGGFIIGAVTGATWDVMVIQGKGGLDNLSNILDPNYYCDVDWLEALFTGGVSGSIGAIVGGTAGAVEIAGHALYNFILRSGAGVGTTLCLNDGDCTNELSWIERVSQGYWNLTPFKRGVAVENALGRSNFLAQNFPVIDRFEKGVATSIKSLDVTAKSYQNVAVLSRTVKGYINTLAKWQGVRWAGVTIRNADITVRQLLLAVPPGMSDKQLQVLSRLQQWAQTQGVDLSIVVVP